MIKELKKKKHSTFWSWVIPGLTAIQKNPF